MASYDKYKKGFRYIYREEIDEFFRGVSYWESHEKGHIWVCEHQGFGTLTVEPQNTGTAWDGGQFEIAVRFPPACEIDHPGDKFSGYIATEDGAIIGRNTGGH